jgi:microcystin-dependent protein
MINPSLSEVRLFAGNFAPRGWAFCSGQLQRVFDNINLYQLLGINFGGDGQTTFGLPSLADLDGGNGGKVHPIICTSGSWPSSMEGFIGAIRLFWGVYPPGGWLPCDGRLVPVTADDVNSQRLLSVLGTAYGGNGSTRVGLPQLAPHPQSVTFGNLPLPQYLICTQGMMATPPDQNGGVNARTEDYFAETIAFAGNYVPQSLKLAQGGSLPIRNNEALWSLIGSSFTANPNQDTFQVPTLAPLQALNGPPIPFLIATDGIFPSRP